MEIVVRCNFCNSKAGTVDFNPKDAKPISVNFRCKHCNNLNHIRFQGEVNF